MRQEMPEHLPPVPDGYVYAGKGPLPTDKIPVGFYLCENRNHIGDPPNTWIYANDLRGSRYDWHYAIRSTSALGRKILAERSKPSWADAPDWAEWLAQDQRGDWYWYQVEPEADLNVDEWCNEGGRLCEAVDCGEPNPNWRTTLERRPENKSGYRSVVDNASKYLPEYSETPDLIIPKDAAAQIEAYSFVSDLARMGYRLEVDGEGIRGWLV